MILKSFPPTPVPQSPSFPPQGQLCVCVFFQGYSVYIHSSKYDMFPSIFFFLHRCIFHMVLTPALFAFLGPACFLACSILSGPKTGYL